MKIVMFCGLERTQEGIDNNFDGLLYTYNYHSIDPFVYISKHFNLDSYLRYFVAIRSHIMSPQYIFKILRSFYHLKDVSGNRIMMSSFDNINVKTEKPVPVCINLISGSIDLDQQAFGGTIGNVDDLSSPIERSQNLIKFIKEFNNVNEKHFKNFFHLNLYVTTTNKYVFEEANKKNNKMIIEYVDYATKKFDITNPENVMVTFGPVIRDTQEELDSIDKTLGVSIKHNSVFCTPPQLIEMLDRLEQEGIQEVLFWSLGQEDHMNMLDFVKQYNGNKEQDK
jgi:hypothetical protein